MRVICKEAGVLATVLGETLYGLSVDKRDEAESSKEKVKKGLKEVKESTSSPWKFCFSFPGWS